MMQQRLLVYGSYFVQVTSFFFCVVFFNNVYYYYQKDLSVSSFLSDYSRFNCPFKYINAETTAGGIAHWATSEVAGQLRTNATDWEAAWQDYIRGIINVTIPNQISAGGPVIGLVRFITYLSRLLTGLLFFGGKSLSNSSR